MKKMISGLFVSTLALSFAVTAGAVELDTPIEGQVSSDATITVNPGAKVPTTPENPNIPDGTTNQDGPLSIDNVIVFAFEEMNLSGTTQRIPLEAKTAQNIQVTDTRGTGTGWNLQIKQTPLVDSATDHELKGAYINLVAGTVVAGNDNVTPEAAPTTSANGAVYATKGEFQKIMTAEKDNGMGTWKSFFNQEDATTDIELVVPSGNMVGNYAGTVVWALTDGPTTNPAS